jgi:hypothetical protein
MSMLVGFEFAACSMDKHDEIYRKTKILYITMVINLNEKEQLT